MEIKISEADVYKRQTEQAVQPADLEAVILEAIDLCFFSRQNISLCSRWNRSEFSESQDIKTGSYIFDIMRFEKQQIQQPDPVFTLNEWLKTSYPEAKIIGYDEMQEVWKASNEAPAIYEMCIRDSLRCIQNPLK